MARTRRCSPATASAASRCTPYFDPSMIAWMERGGAYALVNVRGGGEYGVAWHDAGKLANEQNKLDDFNAAAAWLAANGIATHDRVGSIGTSGGGFLVAAAVDAAPRALRRGDPDRRRARPHALPAVRRRRGLAGRPRSSRGSEPSSRGSTRSRRSTTSSRARTTRAMFIVTSDHDVRVAPLHSYKFAAAMQAAQAGPAPVYCTSRSTPATARAAICRSASSKRPTSSRSPRSISAWTSESRRITRRDVSYVCIGPSRSESCGGPRSYGSRRQLQRPAPALCSREPILARGVASTVAQVRAAIQVRTVVTASRIEGGTYDPDVRTASYGE